MFDNCGLVFTGLSVLTRLRRMQRTPLDTVRERQKTDRAHEEAKAANLPWLVKSMMNIAPDKQKAEKFAAEFWASPEGQRMEHNLAVQTRVNLPVPTTLLFKAMLEANAIALETPLQFCDGSKQFLVPSWHPTAKISGWQCFTIFSLGMFVYLDEDEAACAPLLDVFPIKPVLMLHEPQPWEYEPITPEELGLAVPAQRGLFL